MSIGVNYGQIANNLPSPGRVSWLLRSLKISKVKLYDADPHVLRAFLGTGVEFVVGIGNEHVPTMVNPAVAQAWSGSTWRLTSLAATRCSRATTLSCRPVSSKPCSPCTRRSARSACTDT